MKNTHFTIECRVVVFNYQVVNDGGVVISVSEGALLVWDDERLFLHL